MGDSSRPSGYQVITQYVRSSAEDAAQFPIPSFKSLTLTPGLVRISAKCLGMICPCLTLFIPTSDADSSISLLLDERRGTLHPLTGWHRPCLSPQPTRLSTRLMTILRPQVNCVPSSWMTASVSSLVAGPLLSSLFLGAGGWG